jgi:hypothetical protein
MTTRQLSVLYRGTPIGVLILPSVEQLEAADRDAAEALAAGAEPAHSGHPIIQHSFLPLPGYDLVRQVVRDAGVSLENFGFVGPAADPASAIRGQEAFPNMQRLCSELEVQTEHGQPAGLRITMLMEHQSRGVSFYHVQSASILNGSPVIARPEDTRKDGTNHNDPPTA